MNKNGFLNFSTSFLTAGVLGIALWTAGCKAKTPAPPNDQQIAAGVQAKLQAESELAQQNLQVSAASGVVTLSGSVTDEASRALAGNDAGTVSGVKSVVNNLVVQPVPLSMDQTAAAAKPQAGSSKAQTTSSQRTTATPVQQSAQQPAQQQSYAAPEPPKPVVRQVTLPAGTVLPIRLTETLSSQTAESNQAFHGSLASDIGIHGVIAIPHGSAVTGRVVEAQDAAHFKGSSLLSIELTQVNVRGARLSLMTEALTQKGEGRGKNTAMKAGGGAALGSIIGALAGGGKGAAIGALAGGGAGAGVNAVTRGQQVVLPSETVLHFTLQAPLTLTVTEEPQGSAARESYHPQLQSR